jgi:hypothetical protein
MEHLRPLESAVIKALAATQTGSGSTPSLLLTTHLSRRPALGADRQQNSRVKHRPGRAAVAAATAREHLLIDKYTEIM